MDKLSEQVISGEINIDTYLDILHNEAGAKINNSLDNSIENLKNCTKTLAEIKESAKDFVGRL